MSVLIQHGYGKSDKIERALDRGIADGVILHPRFELPQRLEDYASVLRTKYGEDAIVVVDPHFFLTTFPAAPLTHLPEYPYFVEALGRSDFTGATKIRGHVHRTLDFQRRMPVSRLVAPTVYIDDLSGRWSQIALSLAAESLEYGDSMPDAPPLWLAFAFDETALTSKDAVDEFLDIVSVWEPAGFLLTVHKRDDGYPALHEESALQHLLYIVYVLGERSGFEVVNAYSDLPGFLFRAVGGTYSATGWWNSLRRFPKRWLKEPPPGGQPRNPRYTSVPLINSILVVPELETIADVGYLEEVLSDTHEDGVFRGGRPSAATWPQPTAFLHHLECCQEICSGFPYGLRANVELAGDMISGALSLYDELESSGVQFGPTTGRRNAELWSRVLRTFRDDVGLTEE